MVSRAFVQRYLGGRRPVGTVFLWGRDGKTPFRIVGVVEGTKTLTIGEQQQPQLYEPLDQIDNDRGRIQFVMRSSIPPALQLDGVRKTLHRVEPMAGADVETLYSSIGLAFLPSQIGAALLGSIGVLGVLLAAIGLYGVMVYSVARRTREIGLRIAVGATRRDIRRLFIGDAAMLTALGSAIGLVVAWFVTRPLAMFLVPGLKSTDPINYAVVLIVMFTVALLSTTFPLRKAAGIDPNIALRYE